MRPIINAYRSIALIVALAIAFWSTAPVQGQNVNLALGKPADQSSMTLGGEASRAVDGNTTGHYYSGSVSHTNTQPQPWWRVDLGATYAISSVQIWNRADCCETRLSNFDVRLSNDGQEWRDYHFPGNVAREASVVVAGSARYVEIRLRGNDYLHLAEVQVWGSPTAEGQPTRTPTTAPSLGFQPGLSPSATSVPPAPTSTPLPAPTDTPSPTDTPVPPTSTPLPTPVGLTSASAEALVWYTPPAPRALGPLNLDLYCGGLEHQIGLFEFEFDVYPFETALSVDGEWYCASLDLFGLGIEVYSDPLNLNSACAWQYEAEAAIVEVTSFLPIVLTCTLAAGAPEGSGIQGIVRDAETGQPLDGAIVSAAGMFTTVGPDGRYEMWGIAPGQVSVTAGAEGFIVDTTTVNVPTTGAASQTFALTRGLGAGRMRVILTWGASPIDLDANLWVGSRRIHSRERGTEQEPPHAVLDRDGQNGYGPETITIDPRGCGRVVYAVHNFSAEVELARGNARVRVYRGDSLVRAFTPPSGSDRWWHVFTLSGPSCDLTPVNILAEFEPTAFSAARSRAPTAAAGTAVPVPTAAELTATPTTTTFVNVGTQWQVCETLSTSASSCVGSTWTRQGTGNTWNGTWNNGAKGTLTIVHSGRGIRVDRRDTSTTLRAIYNGEISADNTTASGTVEWCCDTRGQRSGTWTATISSGSR